LSSQQNINQLAGHLFRHEAGKMAAVLTRLLGSDRLQAAEDIVQDTLIKAMETWRFNGVPENPSAWLYKVAKNMALDYLRARQRHEKIHSEIAGAIDSGWTLPASVNHLFSQHEIEDSQLRMMFAICHPAMPEESKIALTLKILGGLSSKEIAHAFLTNEETIQKRIARAKERLREEKISLEVPPPHLLPDRIDAVLKVIYLLFNEGYHPSHSEKEIREDLCEEAIRLAHFLTQNPITCHPQVQALMALMCLQVARFDSRRNTDGLITLEEQDRSRWNKRLMNQGFALLQQAAKGTELTEYHN
jgi:RNA polymerase sigma factor (sigma-70 family)